MDALRGTAKGQHTQPGLTCTTTAMTASHSDSGGSPFLFVASYLA